MPTGCLLRFVSFVGPIRRLLWYKAFLSLKQEAVLTVKICHDTLPAHFGCCQIKIPTRLGLKRAKWITAMFVSKRLARGLWEHRGYSWFAGV
jgi:DMSO/TMAO reductase YedYZ molybdopterin-dependent catalytic subunit